MDDETQRATPGPDQGKRNDFRGRVGGELGPVNLVQGKVFGVHRCCPSLLSLCLRSIIPLAC